MEKLQFVLLDSDNSGELDDKNFKSCFARSVAVNSQYKQKSCEHPSFSSSKTSPEDAGGDNGVLRRRSSLHHQSGQEMVRFRKNIRSDEGHSRRLSCSSLSSSRRTSICSNRIAEIPVENIVHQSKIETLQWQLKEVEKSREMYKAVMKQVVTFLEKAQHSLELIGKTMNPKQTVPRSKSEHQILNTTEDLISRADDYLAYRDFTWRRRKPEPEEIPPEKLSQEAFRLLRTAQSLLSTQEPDLIQQDDLDFLAQLAKEFPAVDKPQRTNSFTPKLVTPKNEDVKIATAFNRKLSLQLSQVRRHSMGGKIQSQPQRVSVAESESDFDCLKKEKPSSPPGGSISSVEDESGFSSMNSFQEVGLPVVNSTMVEEVSAKNALLRSMLHNNSAMLENSKGILENERKIDEVKLWEKPAVHKRWHSTPVEENDNQSLKVLWV